MSIENRLAAKKRSQAARKRAKRNSFLKGFFIALIPIVIIAVVIGIVLNVQSKKIDYSKYVTADGQIEGVKAKDLITKLADYKNLGIKLEDYEPTEEEIEKRITSIYEAVEKKNAEDAKKEESQKSEAEGAAETTGEESKEEAGDNKKETTLDKITDEWVKKNYEKDEAYKEGKYELTKDGFVTYVTESLRESKLSRLRSDITKKLTDNSTISSYPKKYTKNLTQIYTNEEKKAYEAYEQFYSQYYASIYAMYGGKDKFKDAMKQNAEAEVKTTLVCLAIYEELGMKTTLDDVKKYYNEDQGQDYDKLVASYGEGYLMMQCKCAQVLNHLEEGIKGTEDKTEE